jgi:hypothetical protein
MKILRITLYALLGILALLLFAALFVKKEYAISREITIAKPREAVFNYVKYLKNQENYSVWSKIDPGMKKEYRGTDGTVGFVSAWDSKVKDAGKGEQEITKITENERIDCELRFIWPMESKDHIYMLTQSLNDSTTRVKWGFDGKMEYPMNLVLLFMNFDAMVGPDLEKGLSSLKELMEK